MTEQDFLRTARRELDVAYGSLEPIKAQPASTTVPYLRHRHDEDWRRRNADAERNAMKETAEIDDPVIGDKTLDLTLHVRHVTEEQAEQIDRGCAEAVLAVIGRLPSGTTRRVVPDWEDGRPGE